jgi:hypothetical protein
MCDLGSVSMQTKGAITGNVFDGQFDADGNPLLKP